MPKQQSIPGTEPPRNRDLEEVIDQLREAEAAYRRAGEAVTKLRSVLLSRMLGSETAVYDYVDATGCQWMAAVRLPEPSVQLKFVGERKGDD